MRAVAPFMAAMEWVRLRIKGNQHTAVINNVAPPITSQGRNSKKKELVKKLGETNMRTLRRGSSSPATLMNGIRTPTQYRGPELVTARNGAPGLLPPGPGPSFARSRGGGPGPPWEGGPGLSNWPSAGPGGCGPLIGG